MFSPADTFFFPVDIGNFAATIDPQVSYKIRVVGKGVIYPVRKGLTEKHFVLTRKPVGDGSYFTTPFILPTGMVAGDIIIIENDRKSGPRITMKIDKKKKKRVFIGLYSRPQDRGQTYPYREYIVYQRIKGEWLPVEVDGDVFM